MKITKTVLIAALALNVVLAATVTRLLHQPPQVVEKVVEVPKVVEKTVTLYKPVPMPIEPQPRMYLSLSERQLVESVVMAESGAEPFAGQVLVAQCILNACIRDGIQPSEAVERYAYTTHRPTPSESVREAVSLVFDMGVEFTKEPVMYFYAPALVESEFHESLSFVIEIGGHRFFKEAE